MIVAFFGLLVTLAILMWFGYCIYYYLNKWIFGEAPEPKESTSFDSFDWDRF